jgi:hypothetical protein
MEGMERGLGWADKGMEGWLAEHHFPSIYSPRKRCNIPYVQKAAGVD